VRAGPPGGHNPAQGHPAKYYFAGTPEAGAQSPGPIWTPAFAGEHETPAPSTACKAGAQDCFAGVTKGV